jgi:malonate decarboxylase gamma subunit
MTKDSMSDDTSSRGATWLAALTDDAAPLPGYPASVRVVDALLADQTCRYIAVLPDASNPYPRARAGEVGLIEGWALAKAVHDGTDVDAETSFATGLDWVLDAVAAKLT